jgi:GcrA cell cycle regulator
MTLLESADTAPTVFLSHRHPASTWTEERIELLKQMWSDGFSAGQIATKLGGVTRSSVLGKKHRLGIAERAPGWGAGAPIKRGKRVGEHRNRRHDGFHRSPIGQPAAPSLPVDPAAPSPHACALVDLDDDNCHFPIGEPGKAAFHFCGSPAPGDGPYCHMHSRIAYQPKR